MTKYIRKANQDISYIFFFCNKYFFLFFREGESCHHVAALLYALVDITSKQKDGLTAPTSTKCKWNQPRKRKQSPKKSQNLVFKKLRYDETPPSAPKIVKHKQ